MIDANHFEIYISVRVYFVLNKILICAFVFMSFLQYFKSTKWSNAFLNKPHLSRSTFEIAFVNFFSTSCDVYLMAKACNNKEPNFSFCIHSQYIHSGLICRIVNAIHATEYVIH